MYERLDQSMVEAVADTFENLAFMEAVPAASAEKPAAISSPVAASILILEPVVGDISLTLPRQLAMQVAETIYNLAHDEITAEMIRDIVAEFLNTFGGKFLNEFLEPGQMYSLGTPEQGEVASALCEEFVRTWYFVAEGMEFTVTLTGEEFGDASGR